MRLFGKKKKSANKKVDFNRLTPEGELPFGWVHHNNEFIKEQESIVYNQWDAVSKAKRTANYLSEYKNYFDVVNSIGEFCKAKSECHYKWFCDYIIGSVWYNQQVAEYRKLKTQA